ncbi:MAG: RecQ family ATP-dependent DNA helicase [Spirochaetaceae bacterium]
MEDFINNKAKELFNIDYIFPFQRLVISNTLRAAGYYGDDDKLETIPRQIVLLPTGAGKSLCFMLPGIMLEGITLIIFPLLSLMADQERRILETGSTVTILKGGMSSSEKSIAYEKIQNDEVKFILTNPETLRTSVVLELLSSANLNHVVIDETHTVSEWGESFRPTYLEVGEHIKTIGVEMVTAYTATASQRIVDNVIKYIFLGEDTNVVRGNPDRVNITYSVIPCISKKETLVHLVNNIETPAIIFHSSRVSTELTSTFLSRRLERDDIVYYHAGLTKEEKSDIEKWFFDSNSGILNATCAYGMGVDKQGIRTVIHLEAPDSIESYLQESGRGGRDRNPAKAILLTSKNDKDSSITKLIRDNTKCRREGLLSLLGASIEFCSGCDVCNGSVLTEAYGEYQLKNYYIKNKKKFNLQSSSRILKGYLTHADMARQHHNTPGFGILGGWELDSIKDAISVMNPYKRKKL